MMKIIAFLLSSLALAACTSQGLLDRGYSGHYRGSCEKHDLCDFHGGSGY
jgi:hypothetical protein